MSPRYDLGLHLVTDENLTTPTLLGDLVELVRAAVAGGVSVVQLRAKHADARLLLEQAAALARVIDGRAALLINDRLDVALAARDAGTAVAGVHLGQDDVPPATARALLGPDALIGWTANTDAHLGAALELPAGTVDYLGVGIIRATASKDDAPPVLGATGFAAFAARSPLPCVAIGGITGTDVPTLIAGGAAGVAVVSAICSAKDPQSAARALRETIGTSTAERGSDSAARVSPAPTPPVATAASTPAAIPRVLSIAGTDPTGGAGIQADLKSIGALGGYGMAVITTLVAQNTHGVREVHVPPVEFLTAQLEAVSDDVAIDAVKLGMLHSQPLIAAVEDWLTRTEVPIVVLDPVMVATSGDRLLDADAEDAVRKLCRRTHLITPNLPELAVLVGTEPAADWPAALEQAKTLATSTGATVLLKGGHLAGSDCPDAIVTADSVTEVAGRRVVSSNTHGTGCSLSSAMATLAAAGLSWPDALVRAKTWLAGAIEHGADLHVGSGHGPVDHFHELRQHLPAGPFAGSHAGSWCNDLWADLADLRARSHDCSFVQGLRRGDLDPGRFRWYLGQDALYLAGYSRLLARASALAPTVDEQIFWARNAAGALAEEARLHRAHLDGAEPEPAPATSGYVNHLHAVAGTGGYPELIAALLPCFWLYTDIGRDLAAADHDGHPYHDWLATYADPAFAEATRQAVQITDQAARDASAAGRAGMRAAFEASLQHELAFFEAPMH